MTRQLKPCGTIAAYERHLRHYEEACAACKKACAERSARDRAAARRAPSQAADEAA